MNFGIIFVALIATVVVESSSSHFQKIFKKLHQEPPPPPPVSRLWGKPANVKTKTITQKLDHYDEKNNTWKMRYLSNAVHFKSGGPIFIFVGGEWEVSPGFLLGGLMFDMAQEHNGYMFYTEHRYYGKSHPTKNLSKENLKYLSVKQALHDLNHFIITIKKKITGLKESKVILVGGSYSATIVAWFHRMFPNVAAGSWASSAPLLAKVDFIEYMEVVGQSIKQVGGDACYNRIKSAISELEYMMLNNRSAEIKAMFKLCNNFNAKNELDVYTFFETISSIFAENVQNHDYFFKTIQKVCEDIMEGDDDVQGLAKFVLKNTFKFGCVDSTYNAMLAEIASYSDIMRQWTYQTCSEFGWYQSSGSKEQPFGTKFPVDLNINICSDAYLGGFTYNIINSNIEETNDFFGGLTPDIERVYFTHGQLDPWKAMGLKEHSNLTIISNHAHCADFQSITLFDSKEMKASKEKVLELVRSWLKS